jgi:hypothetical protein
MSYQNSRLVEWSLLIFSTFVTIVTIINIVEYVNIINGPANANFTGDQARGWLIVNCILLFIAACYWIYRVYHFFLTPQRREQTYQNIKTFLNEEHKGFIKEVSNAGTKIKNTFSSSKDNTGLKAFGDSSIGSIA